MPLSHFLKQYYKQHPKLGSRDRKILSDMAYCWYRCERALPIGLSFEERVRACLALCNKTDKHLQAFLPTLPLHTDSQLADIFPYSIALSDGISTQVWLQSMLSQPDMFIRIRKNKDGIISILNQHDIPYKEITPTCIALPNNRRFFCTRKRTIVVGLLQRCRRQILIAFR
jgi:16S rRNA (cytosine967-C5)-methyltransferase